MSAPEPYTHTAPAPCTLACSPARMVGTAGCASRGSMVQVTGGRAWGGVRPEEGGQVRGNGTNRLRLPSAAGAPLGSTSTTSTTCAPPLAWRLGTRPPSGTCLAASSLAPAPSKQVGRECCSLASMMRSNTGGRSPAVAAVHATRRLGHPLPLFVATAATSAACQDTYLCCEE